MSLRIELVGAGHVAEPASPLWESTLVAPFFVPLSTAGRRPGAPGTCLLALSAIIFWQLLDGEHPRGRSADPTKGFTRVRLRPNVVGARNPSLR